MAALSLTVAFLATRAALLALPLQAQSLTAAGIPSKWSLKPDNLVIGDKFRLLFLSSTKRNGSSAGIAIYNTWIRRRASAGHAALGDYTIFEVDKRFGVVSGLRTTVNIRESNTSNRPGDLAATLANSSPLTFIGVNTFTAQDSITLDSSATYWITVNDGIPSSSDRAFVRRTISDAQSGSPGWAIGNDRLTRGSLEADWTNSARTGSLMMAIRGIAVPTTTLVSNTRLNSAISGVSGFQAQSFETGVNPGGHTVSEVDVWVHEVAGRSIRVSIREDDGGEPGDLVAVLDNRTSLYPNGTFPAAAIPTLRRVQRTQRELTESLSNKERLVNLNPLHVGQF